MNRLLNRSRAVALALASIAAISIASAAPVSLRADEPENAPERPVVDESDPGVVLYDSKTWVPKKKKGAEEEPKSESQTNVVFVGDVENPPEAPDETPEEESAPSEGDGVEILLNDVVQPMSTPEERAEEARLDALDDLEPTTTAADVEDSCDVLIDMRHAVDFSDSPLTVDDRFYHRIYSFNKAFEYLKKQGVRVEKYESEEPLTPQTLSRTKTLFMNLPSADKAPFFAEELAAIRNFVEAGGSLFLITDHTNCYFHQSRLHPLFHELGIEPQFYGICDPQQSIGSSGNGWIYLDKFDAHPVTQGLRHIAFQTGGGVDSRYAVAWSGPNSWQDAPNMPIYGEADVAFYGNFTHDAQEQVGETGVVLAKDLEKGKIAIVGDQNIFSPFFLQYLDDYKLWLNIYAWLLERPELADATQYITDAKEGKIVLCREELAPGAKRFGDPDPEGYYHLYTTLCRYYNPFCVADEEDALESNVAMILGGGETYSPEGFAFAYDQLKAGRALVVVDPDEGVLENEKSELHALLQKLHDEAGIENDYSPSQGKKRIERVALDNGGKLILVRGQESFNNTAVPKPEDRLLFLQMENVKVLLGELDTLFGKTSEEERAPDASEE